MNDIAIVPQPASLTTGASRYAFSGFRNLPTAYAQAFDVPQGDWTIEPSTGEGTGLRIREGVVQIWGDLPICYATLLQLVLQDRHSLPEVEVREACSFRYRGYHMDLARGGVANVERLKQTCRLLFLFKFNWFALYLEDLFPWSSHPVIGARRGRYSREELDEVVAYGRALGLDVFPALNLLGHMEKTLSLPEYAKYNEWFHSTEGVIDLGNPEARAFTYELLEEALDATESVFLCIGGDETAALGRGQSLHRNEFLYQGPKMYRDHYEQLIGRCKAKGKTPILYGDMLNGVYLTPEERPLWRPLIHEPVWDECYLLNWFYVLRDQDYLRGLIREFGDRMPYELASTALRSEHRYYPDFTLSTGNLSTFLEAARAEHLPGHMVTSWGDGGSDCLFGHLDPLLCAAAELSEGNGEWTWKWSKIMGEAQNVTDARRILGHESIANPMKNLFLDRVQAMDICFVWGASDDALSPSRHAELKDLYESAIDRIDPRGLPEDLQFIVDLCKTIILRLNHKECTRNYIEMAERYVYLWKKERKTPGLDLIVTRMYGQAGLQALSLDRRTEEMNP
jgi:hexosaminidase